MGLGVTIALLYVGGTRMIPGVWAAVLLIFFELTILTGVAIMFSSFSTPALSALLTFFVFIIGHFSASLLDLAKTVGSDAAIAVFTGIFYLLPNLSHFSFITETSNAMIAPPAMIGGAALYAVIYDAILLAVTVLIFSRRNFK